MVADSDEDGKRRRQVACKTEGANANLAVTCKIGFCLEEVATSSIKGKAPDISTL